MDFDDKEQIVYWERGMQKISQPTGFKLFKAIYEKQGKALPFPEAKRVTETKGKNGVSCIISRLRKDLSYNFPFEIKTEQKEGYCLIPKRRI